MIQRLIALLILISICFSISPSYAGESPVISKSVTNWLAQAASEQTRLWLYFDSTQWSSEPIPLSERALARRAKVDSDNFLITASDYSLRLGLADSLASLGLVVVQQSRWLKAISVEVSTEQLNVVLALPGLSKINRVKTYQAETRIEETQSVLPKQTGLTPDQYGFSLMQNRAIGADQLHTVGLTGKGVLIAMFDSGFNPGHTAFDSVSLIATYDFINDQIDVSGADCPGESELAHQDSHGTSTWSVIGAYVPDTIIGVAYGADFALAKTEITCGGTEIKVEEDNWIAAAEWADSIGADIISASLGYYEFQDTGSYTQVQLDGNTALITIAADMAASKNILVVSSAGNERNRSWATILFPADGDSVLAVGAFDSLGNLASFSSPGPSADGRIKPDISSIGISLYAARSITNGWKRASGTSFSAPIVAGGAALALEYDPTLTAMELFDLIVGSGDRFLSPDNNFGHGAFDAFKTAEILKWNSVSPVSIEVGEELTISVTTSGRILTGTSLSGLNLPAWASLIDLGDGTGELNLTGLRSELGPHQLLIVASNGFVSDTTTITIMTYDQAPGSVRIGPNPFTDSVTIFIDESISLATEYITISIFNISGEKVEEIVRSSTNSAETIVWGAHNSAGRSLPPGVYLIQVQTKGLTRQLKLLKLE